jgi:DNA-binding transcriptional regulator of glucitol operon
MKTLVKIRDGVLIVIGVFAASLAAGWRPWRRF